MSNIKYALLGILLMGSSFVQAESGDLKFAFELGVHGGGDEITPVLTTSGTQSITAGGGISAAIGGRMDLTDELIMQVLVGFKEDSVDGANGSISFNRTTIDFLIDKKLSELICLGGGLSYHTSVKLESDGVGTSYVQDESFKDALGFIADAKFDIGDADGFYLSLRMTFIDYESETSINGKSSYSGNSFGLIWGGAF